MRRGKRAVRRRRRPACCPSCGWSPPWPRNVSAGHAGGGRGWAARAGGGAGAAVRSVPLEQIVCLTAVLGVSTALNAPQGPRGAPACMHGWAPVQCALL